MSSVADEDEDLKGLLDLPFDPFAFLCVVPFNYGLFSYSCSSAKG